jgi:dienelactone hydrolase
MSFAISRTASWTLGSRLTPPSSRRRSLPLLRSLFQSPPQVCATIVPSVWTKLTAFFLEVDEIFTTELRHASEEILIKTGQPYQLNLFGGVSHGFGVRGDVTKKEGKYAKEQAFLQAVAWFKYYL